MTEKSPEEIKSAFGSTQDPAMVLVGDTFHQDGALASTIVRTGGGLAGIILDEKGKVLYSGPI